MFRGKAEKKMREAGFDPSRLPPGQYLTEKWPVLHAGSVAEYPPDLGRWDFTVTGEVDTPLRLTWERFDELPRIEVTEDIHCVTLRSRLVAALSGIPWAAIRDHAVQRPTARFAIASDEEGFIPTVL